MENEFLTEESFLLKVENIVLTTGCNYIEAVVGFCEDNGLDVEDVKNLIGRSLSEKIRMDAVAIGYFKESLAKLPI